MKCVYFAIAKMNSNNFSLKKTIWYFVTMFALLQRLVDTNTIQLSGVCLSTLQKLASKLCFYIMEKKIPSAPLAHAANIKEYYENMELLLKKTQYEKHNWNICGDLKVTVLLFGLQLGHTKVCCFLCEWDSYGHKTSLHPKTVA